MIIILIVITVFWLAVIFKAYHTLSRDFYSKENLKGSVNYFQKDSSIKSNSGNLSNPRSDSPGKFGSNGCKSSSELPLCDIKREFCVNSLNGSVRDLCNENDQSKNMTGRERMNSYSEHQFGLGDNITSMKHQNIVVSSCNTNVHDSVKAFTDIPLTNRQRSVSRDQTSRRRYRDQSPTRVNQRTSLKDSDLDNGNARGRTLARDSPQVHLQRKRRRIISQLNEKDIDEMLRLYFFSNPTEENFEFFVPDSPNPAHGLPLYPSGRSRNRKASLQAVKSFIDDSSTSTCNSKTDISSVSDSNILFHSPTSFSNSATQGFSKTSQNFSSMVPTPVSSQKSTQSHSKFPTSTSIPWMQDSSIVSKRSANISHPSTMSPTISRNVSISEFSDSDFGSSSYAMIYPVQSLSHHTTLLSSSLSSSESETNSQSSLKYDSRSCDLHSESQNDGSSFCDPECYGLDNNIGSTDRCSELPSNLASWSLTDCSQSSQKYDSESCDLHSESQEEGSRIFYPGFLNDNEGFENRLESTPSVFSSSLKDLSTLNGLALSEAIVDCSPKENFLLSHSNSCPDEIILTKTGLSTSKNERTHGEMSAGPSNARFPKSKEDLVYEKDVLVAGSLDSLVSLATPTSYRYPDKAYLFAFLLSGRLFFRPHHLLGILAGLSPHSESGNQNQTDSSRRNGELSEEKATLGCYIVRLLRDWTEAFPYDFRDEDMMSRVRDLTHHCLSLRASARPQVTQILHTLLNKLTQLERYEEKLSKLASTIDAGLPISDICEWGYTHRQIAEQLTSIEMERLSFVGPEEFVEAFAKDHLQVECNGVTPHPKRTSNLESYVEWFNRLSSLVATQACSPTRKKRRVQVIESWVEVARECFSIGNFNSLMAIVAGLNLGPVSRLRKTWSKIDRTRFSILEHQMDPSSNFSSYRSSLKAAVCRSKAATTQATQKVVVPFFSLLVKDFYFLNEGCASRLPNGYLNFGKFWQLANNVTEFLTWREVECPFPKDEGLCRLLQATKVSSETELTLVSYDREAPDSSYEKERLKALKQEPASRV